MQDFRFALRLIRRQPLLTAAAALTVAFGVGANSAIVTEITACCRARLRRMEG